MWTWIREDRCDRLSIGKGMRAFGRFKVSLVNHGFYRLDGGAMFGTVPKNIWSRLIPADDENCIRLATRSLLVETGDRVILADVGNGDKWNEKFRRIYGIQNLFPDEAGFNPASVTDIVLSHLHFDHSGGLSRYKAGSPADLELCYPGAKVFLQADNHEAARNPNPRERASYLEENVRALEQASLRLTRGSEEIYPGVWVHQNNGHTRGQQWLELKSGPESIVFPSDLIPTSHHLPLPFTMGYDMSAETLLREKADFLERALAERWIVVFVHDPDIPAGRVIIDDKGRYALGERFTF
jgi:glyoxylase-like metal-dependent hydrolase (beta-lactamase superfamily II)